MVTSGKTFKTGPNVNVFLRLFEEDYTFTFRPCHTRILQNILQVEVENVPFADTAITCNTAGIKPPTVWLINTELQLEFRFSAWARARPRPDADRGKSRQRVEKMFLYLLKLCRESRIFQFKTSNKLKDERRAGQFPELLIHRSSSTMFKILVSIQQDGVTNGTVGCVIFIITYFQSLIFY